MKCEDAESYMMKYMDGTLLETEAYALNLHIRECKECKEAFAIYDLMLTEIPVMPDFEAPEDFELMVMAKIESLPHGRVRVTYSLRDKIKGRLWGVFTILFGSGTALVLYREPIMASLSGNPYFSAYIERLAPVSERIAEHTAEAAAAVNNTVAMVNGTLSSMTGVLFFLLTVVCAVQAYLVQRRKHTSKVGRK